MFKKKLDDFIDEYCRLFKFSGALRVSLRDEIIYQRFIGCADNEANIAIHEQSMFNFYSLSKPFCAIGLLKLKDKGLVDLDKHPMVYLSEMEGFEPSVTIRQMLHHVSGLPDYEQTIEFANQYYNVPSSEMRKYLKILSGYPSFFEPGTAGMYANINFVPLALIIENVSGMTYADYMEKEIFEPLGMKTAQVDSEGLVVNNRVKGYDIDGECLVHVERATDFLLGAGDIIGTLDAVYCLNKAIKNKKLLKDETWQEILTSSPINHMGMGCTISEWHGKKRITHNGAHTGFRTLHIQLPEDDLDIILLSNCGYGDARNVFAEAIHQAFYGKDTLQDEQVKMDTGYIKEISAVQYTDFLHPKMPVAVQLNKDDEENLLGQYGLYRIEKLGNFYCITKEDGRTLHCYPIGNGMFHNLYVNEAYSITEDVDGNRYLFGNKKSPINEGGR